MGRNSVEILAPFPIPPMGGFRAVLTVATSLTQHGHATREEPPHE